MSYFVNPILTELRPELLARLKIGELRRVGGVLRVAKGYSRAGSIAAHLRDVGDLVDPMVSASLHLTQVAAAASVVNLGVSVAGFALVLHKMAKLQQSVNALAELTQRQHGEVMGALDGIASQLIELRYVAFESRELLEATLDEVRRVRRDLLDSYLARVLTEVDLLRRAKQMTEHDTSRALRTFGEARRWLEQTIHALPARARDDAHWFDRLLRFRVWCLTSLAEVQLLRRVGDDRGAAVLTRALASTGRGWAHGWSEALLPSSEFHGAFRFAHSAFNGLDREVYVRLVRLQEVSARGTVDNREVEARMEVARAMPRLGPPWIERQRALAGLLDFAEEATARIESLADEMEMCVDERLSYAHWEALAAPAKHGGIAVIEREERT